MNNKYILAGLSLLIGLGLGYLLFAGSVLGGTTNYDFLALTDGLSIDGTTVIDTSGVFIGAVNTGSNNLIVGSDGTSIDQINCDTATWDPSSVSSSTAQQSLDIANAGAALGDVAFASLDSVRECSSVG